MGNPGPGTASEPPPSPKSPPKYPDFCGRRRLQLEVQILNREIGFLEVELQSLEGLQTVPGCCKDVNNFVGTKADPLLPISKRRSKSKCMWRWLSGCIVELEEPNCSCQPNCSYCKIQCQCPCNQDCRCSENPCSRARCSCWRFSRNRLCCSCSCIRSCKLRGPLGDIRCRSNCNWSGTSGCRACCNCATDGSCCSAGCCKWISRFKSFCRRRLLSCCGPRCKFLKLSWGELSCSSNCSCFRSTKICSCHRFTSICCFSGCVC